MVRIEEFVLPGSLTSVAMDMSDGEKLAEIILEHPAGSTEKHLVICGQAPSCFTYWLDWSQYHQYRFEVRKGGKARFYVDGFKIHEMEYSELKDWSTQPHVAFFLGAESVSWWDWVRYETCARAPEEAERPPLEVQVANLQQAVDLLAAPQHVKSWLRLHLDQVLEITDPVEQGQALYQIGRQLFMMKFAGVVQDDAAELETLLDFSRDTVAPQAYRYEGYRGKLQVTSQIEKKTSVVPGKENATIKLFLDVSPVGQHISNDGRFGFSLAARVGVVDMKTGQVISLGETTVELPDRLSPRMGYRTSVEFEWDGTKSDGSVALAGEWFFFDANITYQQFERVDPSLVVRLDEAAGWMPMDGGLVPLQETWVANHFAGKATEVHSELFRTTEATKYFIHTGEPSSATVDPALYVLRLGSESTLAANDECETEMDRWRTWVVGGQIIYYPVRVECSDESGAPVDCPVPYGTRDACIQLEIAPADVDRFFILYAMSSGNGREGTGSVSIWKKIEHRDYNEYRRLSRMPGASFGGTHVRFMNGWEAGYEIDAIIPSPERAREISPFLFPAATPAGIFVMDPLISRRAMGNGMAGGARVTGLSRSLLGKVVLESRSRVDAPAGQRAWAVDMYLNDVGHGDDDGDGLGVDLENAIWTDPDNRDTDGDGIFDGFEVLGIRGAGLFPDQALPTWGADPRHKDVFVETDYFSFCSGEAATKCYANQHCKSGFCHLSSGDPDYSLCACANDNQCRTASETGSAYNEKCVVGESGWLVCMQCGAPLHPEGVQFAAEIAARCSGGPGYLDNPDSRDGFSLHVDNGISSINTTWGNWGGVDAVPPAPRPPPPGTWYPWGNYYDEGWMRHLNPIRQGIFHYGVGYPGGGGNGLIGFPGQYFNSVWKKGSGGFFIHELGHNLGSPGSHAGDDEPGSTYNYKPHYRSLMNYAYSYCSPNSFSEEDSLRACDPDFLRFSEGERRYLLDNHGRRIKDESGQDVIFAVDPAAIEESQPWYNVTKQYGPQLGLSVHNDFEKGIGKYHVEGDGPFIRVDWNHNSIIDSGLTKSDLLGLSWQNYIVFESNLAFGPQLLNWGDVLLSFIVPRTGDCILYKAYYEENCDPENIYTPCGHWWNPTYGICPPSGIPASDMSIIKGPESGGSEKAYLFYSSAQSELCLFVGDPILYDWQGPACRYFNLSGPPEAVSNGEQIIVFGAEPHPLPGTGLVKMILIDPSSWWEVQQWSEQQVYYRLDVDGPAFPLSSSVAPAAAIDPFDGRIYLIIADWQSVTRVLRNVMGFTEYYFLLPDQEYWRRSPGSLYYYGQWTDYRPSLAIERFGEAVYDARWTLWFHGDGRHPETEKEFWRVTSSYESHGDNAFTITNRSSPDGLFSKDLKNVSLTIYRRKLRAALSYDLWERGENSPGWVFMPLADGIFHASLKDVNDVERIAENMSIAARGNGLFYRMNAEEKRVIFQANNMPVSESVILLTQPYVSQPEIAVEPDWFTPLHR
ncbi:MAG: hypothetical protein ABIN58_01160 [candidate division WOR-3 bacterium]